MEDEGPLTQQRRKSFMILSSIYIQSVWLAAAALVLCVVQLLFFTKKHYGTVGKNIKEKFWELSWNILRNKSKCYKNEVITYWKFKEFSQAPAQWLASTSFILTNTLTDLSNVSKFSWNIMTLFSKFSLLKCFPTVALIRCRRGAKAKSKSTVHLKHLLGARYKKPLKSDSCQCWRITCAKMKYVMIWWFMENVHFVNK